MDDETVMRSPGLDPGLPTIEGYRLEHEIGAGGMGSVYAAQELALGRRVAIKLISGSMVSDPATLARFEREARTLATIEHPNVVRVYSFGRTGGIPYLAMEHIAGETLADRISQARRIPPVDALRITREIAEALEAAWERRIIHRDIKPSNVLLDERSRVHVADFGLAKPLVDRSTDSITESGLVVGTAHYISPEQAQGRDIDFRSDIYSLGIVLYEMLTGEKPFQASTPIGIIARHLREPLPPLPPEMQLSRGSFEQLLRSMTAKNPDDRPSSYPVLFNKLDTIAAELRGARPGVTHRGPRVLLTSIAAASLIVAVGVWSRQPSTGAGQTIVPVSSPEPTYTGEPISLTLKDADIRDVIEKFADVAGWNIVIDNDVRGTVSIKLVSVPSDQALEALLKQNGLASVVEGSVIRIARLDTLVAEKEKERRLQELASRPK